jgi:hypothetical protein
MEEAVMAKQRPTGIWRNLCFARAERGIALPMVLLAVAVLGVLTIISLQVSMLERTAGGGSLSATKSFYTAEAGLHSVIASWDSARYDTMTALAGAGDSLSLGKHVVPENGQVYHPMIHHLGDSTSKHYRVTSQAWDPAASEWGRRVGVTVAAIETFEFVLFSVTGLEHTQSDIIGDIGANGSIGLGASVTGNVYAGGTVTDHSQVSGIVKEGVAARNFASEACPAALSPSFGQAGPSYGQYGPMPIGDGVTLDPYTGDLTIVSSTPTTFADGTYYFNNVWVEGSGGLAVTPGATVKIYVSGSLTISGSGYVNQNGPAESFKLYSCGGANTDWVLTTSRESWLQVRAPDVALTFNNSGDNHGIFVAGKILKDGSGIVTYEAPNGDPQFSQAGGSGSFRPIPGTWVDLTGAPSTTVAPIDADPVVP